MSKRGYIFIALTILLLALVGFFVLSSGGTQTLWDISEGGSWLLPLVAVSALIDSINPCAFSILLLTIAFLFSLGKLRGGILKIGGAYVAGIFLSYLLIGLGLLQVLHLFGTPHFMAKLGATLLVLLGLINVINEFVPKFPIKLKIPHAAHHKIATLMEKASLPTAFLLGALVGVCEFPCTGGPYLLVIGLLYDAGTYLSGIGYLLLYNLIFVSPLILILFIASDHALLDKVKVWQESHKRGMRLYGGIAMIALGLLIFLF